MANKLEKIAGTLALASVLSFNSYSQDLDKPKDSVEKPKKDVFYRAMQGTYVGLNIADYFVTENGLKNGAREANPVAKHFVNNKPLFIGYKALFTGGLLFLTDKIHDEDPKLAKGILIGANLLYGAVLANNISVTIKLNKRK